MVFKFDNFSIDTERRELKGLAGVVHVEPQVFDLLLHFVQNRGRVISKDELVERIWKGRAISDAALNSRINAARRAIGDTGERQALIRTVPRRGFLFAAEVTSDQATAFQMHGQAPTKVLNPALPDKPSIAVLPFNNLSGDPEQEYFSDGVSEDVITDLSKIAGLLVIARNSSFAYKGKNPDIRVVGRELGVSSVLEGSIRRAGNRVRITAQLVNTANGAHLWAERYDRDLTDIFAVQDDVTRCIVDALKVKLTPAEAATIAETPTGSFEAHDLFLRGRELIRGTKWNRGIFEQAVALFKRAIELDPNYAEAYAGLAMMHNMDFHNKWSGAANALEIAERFVSIAIEKDPSEPFAHWIAAVVATWKKELERAKQECKTTLALSPNYAPAYGSLCFAELYGGNPEAALAAIECALRLDPGFAHQYLHVQGSAYLVAGKYEAAAVSFRERIRLLPETDLSRGLLVSALGHLGKIDEAQRVWAELKALNSKYTYADHLARLPFANSADAERIKEGFEKAGLVG